MPISSRLADLGAIVERGGGLAQNIRQRGMSSELKADGSIVTLADREVELLLREELTRLVPGTTVWGEEFGFAEPGPNGLWVVDPVDGTSNFNYGSPLWGVTAALVEGDEILLGAVVLPDLGELYVVERGSGAYRGGAPLRPIPHGPVRPEELVSFSDGLARRYPKADLPGKMRLAGAFVIDGTFTATQRYRGLLGHKERLYDVAACVLMGQELDADVRYTDGSSFSVREITKPVPIGRPWMIFPKDSGFFL